MGILKRRETGDTETLSGRTLVGRGPDCTVRVADRRVSGEHAAIVWADGKWEVRDLGSRNGTFVQGRRLGPGDRVTLREGMELSIGAPELTWTMFDAGPPAAQASREDGDEVRTAVDGVLLLPDDEAPVISVYRDAGGVWLADGEQGTRVARDREVLVVAGHPWRLHVPTAIDPTVELGAMPHDVHLHFRVSTDEEYVEIDVGQAGIRREVGVFAANYLLLTLARRRLGDLALPDAEQGWIGQDELAEMLRIDPNTVNVQVHRARQRVGAVIGGLAEVLIERRRGTRQLRLGIPDVTIDRI